MATGIAGSRDSNDVTGSLGLSLHAPVLLAFKNGVLSAEAEKALLSRV